MSLGIGIVGLGSIGRMHARHLDDHAREWDCELVGGADVAPSARERFAETYDCETFADPTPLYDRCDAVIVATPNRHHESVATGALEAGLDVLVEKPLAHSLESAERIVEAAETADGVCMVGFQSRFSPAASVLDGYLDRGRLGDVYHVEARYLRRRGVPGLGSWFTDRELAGGGALIDVGVHVLDLGLHFLGFPAVEEVSSVARSQFGGRDDYTYLHMWGEDGTGDFEVEDSVSGFVRCAAGRTLSLEVAWAANRPPAAELVIRGTDGGARIGLHDGDLTLYESPAIGRDHHATTQVETADGDAHVEEKRRFLAAARAGEPPDRNTVAQALAVQRVVTALYQSSDAGEAVRIH